MTPEHIIIALLAAGLAMLAWAAVAQRGHIDAVMASRADWKARALKAEAELTRLTDRDAKGRFVRREK